MNNNGIVFVAGCSMGKTTRLFELFKNAYNANKNILVLDSATEHRNKSLINKIIVDSNFTYKIISSCEKSEIVFPNTTWKAYPYDIVEHANTNTFLCDVALYLERGYNFPEGLPRESERILYKKLSMQIIEILSEKVDIILMDEIELIPESKKVIDKIYMNNIELYMTLHELKGLSGLDKMFKIEEISL